MKPEHPNETQHRPSHRHRRTMSSTPNPDALVAQHHQRQQATVFYDSAVEHASPVSHRYLLLDRRRCTATPDDVHVKFTTTGSHPPLPVMMTAVHVQPTTSFNSPTSSVVSDNSTLTSAAVPAAVVLAGNASSRSLDQIMIKISKVEMLIQKEQGKMENNVQEYLRLSSALEAETSVPDSQESIAGRSQRLVRLKQLFEKKNQSSTQAIEYLRRKHANYERRKWLNIARQNVAEQQASGVGSHVMPRDVTETAFVGSRSRLTAVQMLRGQGLKNKTLYNKSRDLAANLKASISGWGATEQRGAGGCGPQSSRNGNHLSATSKQFGSADDIGGGNGGADGGGGGRRLNLSQAVPRSSNSGPSKVDMYENLADADASGGNTAHKCAATSKSSGMQLSEVTLAARSLSGKRVVSAGPSSGRPSLSSKSTTLSYGSRYCSIRDSWSAKSRTQPRSQMLPVPPNSSKVGHVSLRCASDIVDKVQSQTAGSEIAKHQSSPPEACSSSASSSSASNVSMSLSEAAVQARFDKAVAENKLKLTNARLTSTVTASKVAAGAQTSATSTTVATSPFRRGPVASPSADALITDANELSPPTIVARPTTAAMANTNRRTLSPAVSAGNTPPPPVNSTNCNASDRSEEWSTVLEELMLHKEEVDLLREHMSESCASLRQDFESAQRRLDACEATARRIETQIADISELHRHELTNFKAAVAEMDERFVYQLDARWRETHDQFVSLDAKLSAVQHQQNQYQLQYLNLEGLSSSDARAILMKVLTVAITSLQVVLYISANVVSLIRPFFSSYLRIACSAVLAYYVYHHCTSSSNNLSNSVRALSAVSADLSAMLRSVWRQTWHGENGGIWSIMVFWAAGEGNSDESDSLEATEESV